MPPPQSQNNLIAHSTERETGLVTFLKQAREDLEWEKVVTSARLEAEIEMLCINASNEEAAKNATLSQKHKNDLAELRKRQVEEWEELREGERRRFEEVIKQVEKMRHEFEMACEKRKMNLDGVVGEWKQGAAADKFLCQEGDEVVVWGEAETIQLQDQDRARGEVAEEEEWRGADTVRSVQEKGRRSEEGVAAPQKLDGTTSDAFADSTTPTRLSSPSSSSTYEDRSPRANPNEVVTLSSPTPTPPEYQQRNQETLRY